MFKQLYKDRTRLLAILAALSFFVTTLLLAIPSYSLGIKEANNLGAGDVSQQLREATNCQVEPGTVTTEEITVGNGKLEMTNRQKTANPETEKAEAINSGNVSQRWTGEAFSQTIGISNTDLDPNKVYRVYFRFTDKTEKAPGYVLGGKSDTRLEVGNTYYQGTGEVNPYTFNQVEDSDGKAIPGYYFIEVAGSKIGDAFSLPVKTKHDSPASAGGKLQVWMAELSAKEKADLGKKGQEPTCQVQENTWDTIRQKYQALKSLTTKGKDYIWGPASEPSIAYDATSGKYYIKNLRYSVQNAPMTTEGQPKKKVGQDPATDSTYVDTFTLPEGVEFNPEYLKSLGTSGSTSGWWEGEEVEGWYSGSGYYLNAFVQKNGKNIPVFGVRSKDLHKSAIYYQFDEQKRTLTLTYKLWARVDNKADYVDRTMDVRFADNFLLVTKPQPKQSYQLSNKFEATTEYTHTQPAKSEVEVKDPVTMQGAKPEVTKTHEGGEGQTFYRGDPIDFTITAKNNGSSPWKINEGKEDEGIIADHLPEAYYVAPSQMAKMFSEDGDGLTIKITGAKICENYVAKNHTTTSGKEKTEQAYLECATAKTADLTLTKQANGKIAITRSGEPEVTTEVDNTAAALQAALKDLVVVQSTRYQVTWEVPNHMIHGGSEVKHVVRATVKDDFMAGPTFTDKQTTNRVNLNDKDVPDKVTTVNSFKVSKTAYVKNKNIDQKGTPIPIGTVVKYQLSLERKGGKAVYNALPFTDKLSGAQVLLVPVKGENATNPDLQGLKKYNYNGQDYYLLDTQGRYRNVHFSATETVGDSSKSKDFIADRIEVKKLENGAGISTSTYWYMASQEFANPSTVSVEYLTLTDPEKTGYTQVKDGHPDALNIGGVEPPEYKVTDQTEMSISKLGADKKIVTKRGATFGEDSLVTQSPLKSGEKVTYRLGLSVFGDQPFKLTGNQIYDVLPPSLPGKPWTEKNLTLEVPTGQKGLKVTAGDLKNWKITNANPADGSISGTQQYIVWDQDLQLEVSGSVYMYVTWQLPKGNEWESYRKKYLSDTLFNTWHVLNDSYAVSHYLSGKTGATLQKGVADTGVIEKNSYKVESEGKYSWSSHTETFITLRPDETSTGRVTYNNSSEDDRTENYKYVRYYNVLHNDGESRLYINDIQDVLPKGFHFVAGIDDKAFLKNGQCQQDEDGDNVCTTYKYRSSGKSVPDGIGIQLDGSETYYDELFPPGSSHAKMLPVRKTWRSSAENTPVDFPGEKPKIASLRAIVDSQNPSHVTFRLDNSQSGSNLGYDAERDKYYLNPGETIGYSYLVAVGEKIKTEDLSRNQIVMPYDNQQGGGVKLNPDIKITSKPLGQAPANDGDRQIIDTNTANQSGFVGGDDNTQWLSSPVDLTRGAILPGVSKKLISKTNAAGTTATDPKVAGYADTLNWEVTAHNDGKQPITDYVISDRLNPKYVFTGTVTYTSKPPKLDNSNVYGSGNSSRYQLLTFKEGTWKYDSKGKPQSVQVTYPNPAYGYSTTALEVNGTPLAVRGHRTIFHVSLTMVGEQLQLNVRAIPGTDGKENPGQGYAVPGNPLMPEGTATLQLSSTNPEKKGTYRMVYNSAYITPIGETFDQSALKHGSNTTQDLVLSTTTSKNENDSGEPDSTVNPYYCWKKNDISKVCASANKTNLPSVQADASVPIAQDAYTSSIQSVEEKANPENKVTSTTPADEQTYISLPSQSSLFTYTLEVKNNTDDAIKRLTLINNLPQSKDNYSFTPSPARGSQFQVDFADNPNLTVEVKDASGNWVPVDPSKYTVEYSDKSGGFSPTDWDGSEKNGWYATPTSKSRSLRVNLDERTADSYTLSAKATLRVRFDAKIAGGANPNPGEIAWNSFGYNYLAPGASFNLESSPARVGVKVPAEMQLQKQVQDENKEPLQLSENAEYTFLVYTGEKLTPEQMIEKTLIENLKKAGRSYIEVKVPVAKGASSSGKISLNSLAGKPASPSGTWSWQDGERYTLAELPPADGTEFSNYQVSTGSTETPVEHEGEYSFSYNPNENVTITGTNIRSKWEINLFKADGDDCGEAGTCTKGLAGAVFGLYSPEQSQQISADKLREAGLSDLADSAKTVTQGEKTYYLSRVVTTATDGKAAFKDLNKTEYFVKELKTPDKYTATWEGQLFQKPLPGATGEQPGSADSPVMVKNYQPYELPKSGGIGTLPFTLFGLMICGGAAYGWMRYRRRHG